MKYVIHKANERGIAEFGWLHSRHSFSFGEYYNPDKMGFGLLRVLNDDIIEAGEGFGTHPHNNMEIISIPLEGSLEHKDSMGTGSVITSGEVQVMSAGTGITHSEFNPSKVEDGKFLQLWIIPKERNIKPRYDQRRFDFDSLKNGIQTLAAGSKSDSSLYIHQDAAVSIGKLDKDNKLVYKNLYKGNGAYLFVLDGSIKFENVELGRRDAVGIYETDEFTINASSDASFIIVEVPMNLN
jgi:redox-sensitive bicupin YhaK (pirin superfamily)